MIQTITYFEASNLNKEFVILDKDVRLGINKVPVAQFDVNGDAYIESDLIVNKDVFINSQPNYRRIRNY